MDAIFIKSEDSDTGVNFAVFGKLEERVLS